MRYLAILVASLFCMPADAGCLHGSCNPPSYSFHSQGFIPIQAYVPVQPYALAVPVQPVQPVQPQPQVQPAPQPAVPLQFGIPYRRTTSFVPKRGPVFGIWWGNYRKVESIQYGQ